VYLSIILTPVIPAGSFKVEAVTATDAIRIVHVAFPAFAFVCGLILLRRRQPGYYTCRRLFALGDLYTLKGRVPVIVKMSPAIIARPPHPKNVIASPKGAAICP
jgi:hypothetical protein